MVRIIVDEQGLVQQHKQLLITDLASIGESTQKYVRRLTRFRTGQARRSVYWLVLDENGSQVAGNRSDDNGHPVPSSFPGVPSGVFLLIVGAGEGKAHYFIWLEIGAQGRSGDNMLAQGNQEMVAQMKKAARDHGWRVA